MCSATMVGEVLSVMCQLARQKQLAVDAHNKPQQRRRHSRIATHAAEDTTPITVTVTSYHSTNEYAKHTDAYQQVDVDNLEER